LALPFKRRLVVLAAISGKQEVLQHEHVVVRQGLSGPIVRVAVERGGLEIAQIRLANLQVGWGLAETNRLLVVDN
jgi:hypothetical protein